MTAPFKKRVIDASRIVLATRQSLSEADLESGAYVVGRVYEVPLNRIHPNPLNSRAIYPESAAKRLRQSFLDKGQGVAACGFLDLAGDVILIDGLRRFQTCEALGWKTLRVEIRPLPPTEQALYLASRSANLDREDQTPLDDAIVWTGLLKRNVFKNQASLSKTLGVDEATVSRTIKLTELPATVIQALAEHPKLLNLKMLNAMRELCRLQGEEKTQVFIIEVARDGLSYRDVEARRKKLEHEPIERKRATVRREISCFGAKGFLRTFEKDGRLELSLKGLDPRKIEQVVMTLEKALQSA
jgi:ParB family transcriptional regulator, chromosome partitioning protein